MSLTQRFRTVLAIQVALGVCVAILLSSLVVNQNDRRRSQDAHHQASLLADELRQSSDDLTRMARSYVVTGDARFESAYRAILDIRNGKLPRPVEYHRVYWDLTLPGSPPPRPAGVAISMKELLARQALTAVEREMLTRAQDNSDALAGIEEIALHAVNGQFADASGAFTVHGTPDRALATRLMNDAAYFERKAAIMAPIDTFYVLLERRTADRVRANERRATMLLQALGVLLLTISGAFMYSFLSLRRQIAARERSERELATTAALLERAGAVARVGGWELDLRTMAHFWSAETCRILEVDPPVAPPLDQGINFYAPDDRPVISAAVQAAIDDGTPYDVELSALTAKGRRIHVRAQGVAVRENGRTVQLQGALQDITERKEAEAALQASDARLEQAFGASPIGMGLVNLEGRYLKANRALCAMLGWSESEMLAMDFQSVTHPDDVAASLALSREMLSASRPSYEIEKRYRRKDGGEILAQLNVSLVRDAAGMPVLFVAQVQDITARKLAEATLRLEGAALHAVANAVLITNRAGLIEWANPAFTTFTGYRLEEALGRTPAALLHSGAHDPAFYHTMWNTILAGDVWHGELVNKRKDGSRYLEEMTITPLVDPSGTITHFIAIKQDITQRKTLESQLLQAQKMESVGLLAGGVAHDFNNMLGVILGTVEIAMEQVDPAQPLYEDLLEIRKATVRSADLTRQLLAFARRQTIAPTVLDLNETVPGLLSMLQRLIGEDISLLWQPATALWPVLMDRSQMDQILTNLCVNARHAIAGIGTVRIATANAVADAAFCAQHAEAVSGEYVQLSVHDTGSGMDAATQARIFEPFFSTKDLGAGIGLGLATVYGAVKQNQGFVTVASTLGAGTTFDIYLPRHEGSATPARQTGAVAADLRGSETILVVEDEPALSRLATKALDAQGYLVLTANSAAEALRLASAHAGEIHLLLSDVVMPEMNGRDLAHALLELRPTLRPLFMSGHTADVIAIRGLLAPGVAFIGKPFTPVALAAKVREVLDSA